MRTRFPAAAYISAGEGDGMDLLRDRIEALFYGRPVRVQLTLSAGDGRGISLIRRLLHDARNHYLNDLCVLSGTIESKQMSRLEAIPGAEVRYLM
jgi:50S ribosomal subunit-associated GTPase HflX